MRRRAIPILVMAVFGVCAFLGFKLDLFSDPAPLAHEGVWYFAANAVECRVEDGKIYQDDAKSDSGQSLRGVYTQADGYLEAHLVGVGGVRDTHKLYVGQTDQGQVLSELPNGLGTVYFYRDPVEAMAVLEETRASAAAEEVLSPAPLDALTTEDPSAEPSDGPSQAQTPEAPSQAPDATAQAPAPDAGAAPAAAPAPVESKPKADTAPVAPAADSTVWVSQTGSKYHKDPTCSGMKSPSSMTRTQAESRGYTPCKRCY